MAILRNGLMGLSLAVALAACHGHHDGSNAKTLTQIAKDEIAGNTSETAVPIQINDLPVDASDSTDQSSPVAP